MQCCHSFQELMWPIMCHNPSLGLATKERAYKGAGQKWSSRVTFHAPESVRDYEGMNPHIPKWAPTLGVGVPMDFQIFKGRLWGSKLIGLKSYLYHQKALKTWMSKMGSHDPFEYLKHKLWPKEGRKLNYQFDSQPLKVENRPDLLAWRWCVTHLWKVLNKG